MTEHSPLPLSHGFQVRLHESEDALIVECFGRLTSEHSPTLKNAVRDRIATHKRIVLDLKEVPQIDSSGLGTVVGLYVSGRTRGCRIEMRNANQAVRDLFSMTNLLSLFEAAGRHHGKTI